MNPLPVIVNAGVEIPAAVRTHIDGARYQIATLLPLLRADADRVIVTGDTSVVVPMLAGNLPPCCDMAPIATFVAHITHVVPVLAQRDVTIARKVLAAKAAATVATTATTAQVVIVVLLASGETGVMVAELEVVPAAPTPEPVCNAPGGRA